MLASHTVDSLPFVCQTALKPTASHLPVSTADSLHQRQPAGLSVYLYSQHPGISCQLALQPTAYHLYVCLVTAYSLKFACLPDRLRPGICLSACLTAVSLKFASQSGIACQSDICLTV
jgi:hypothetical protein